MAHFFRVLADPHATFDKEVPGEPDGEERRHALAAYVSLELMRVQVEREHRHPLRDWMSRTLNAQGASSNTISVLTKLSIARRRHRLTLRTMKETNSVRFERKSERAFRDGRLCCTTSITSALRRRGKAMSNSSRRHVWSELVVCLPA